MQADDKRANILQLNMWAFILMKKKNSIAIKSAKILEWI
jgi:hypothetical protein